MITSKIHTKKQTVFVGVSGGVDSSVSAALLLEQGFNVVGVFIKTWQPDWVECTWKSEKRDAIRVCAHLGIPFLFFDFEKEYKEGVADYMIREYQEGRTPNPDVMCNKEVKFGAFLRKAKDMGADFIATGHYAINKKNKDHHELLMGKDNEKDQSYFLWTLNENELKSALFPVGHLRKSEVRKLAQKFKLPTADKKDSQGVCFIGPMNMKEFLSHYIQEKEGCVLDEQGKIIGTHSGSLFYTIGERHGFSVANKKAGQLPLYVVEKDISKNTITVSSNKHYTDSKSSEIILKKVNIIGTPPVIGKKYTARSRYRETLFTCRIVSMEGDSLHLKVEGNTFLSTPGQSFVIYEKNRCIGGGIIC